LIGHYSFKPSYKTDAFFASNYFSNYFIEISILQMEAGHFAETSEQTFATWRDNPNKDHYSETSANEFFS